MSENITSKMLFNHLFEACNILRGLINQDEYKSYVIVNNIDGIVKIVRFDGWEDTTEGKKDVKKALRQVTWKKYGIKEQEVFDKAYSYIEQYY